MKKRAGESEWVKHMTASTNAMQPFNMAGGKQQLFNFLQPWLGQEVTKTSISGQMQGLCKKNIITQQFAQMRF